MIIQRQLDAQSILDRFEPLESSVEDLCEMADERRKQRKLSEAQLLCDEGVNAARIGRRYGRSCMPSPSVGNALCCAEIS